MAKQTTKQIETATAPVVTLGTYQAAVSETKFAVTGDSLQSASWRAAGRACGAYWPNAEKFEAEKARFIADAIVPAIPKDQQEALAAKLPRKGTDEYNALNEKGKAAWEKAQKAKISARAYANTMFSRVKKYAFPPEKAEGEPKARRDLAARIAEELAKLVKVCESAESAPFDLPKEIAALKAALVIVAKTN